jgi:hypothetical protein
MQNPIRRSSRPALTMRSLVSREGVALVARLVENLSHRCRVAVACLSRRSRVPRPSLWGRREKPLISVNIVNRLSIAPPSEGPIFAP